MADRFYVAEPLQLGPYQLDGPEAHHLIHVRRMQIGDTVTLFNGDGNCYLGTIETLHKKQAQILLHTIATPVTELPFHLQIASALPKGDRLDFLIEKLTELGVTEFIPLQTERSIVIAKENKIEKLERAVIEASKQCGRNCLMRIHAPLSWKQYLHQTHLPKQRWIAHVCEPQTNLSSKEDITLAIGPEGGFTDEEVQQAQEAGWQVLSLGPRILRIETAAITVAALLAMR